MTRTPAAEGWDRQYETGRYKNEPPIPFVKTITDSLSSDEKNGFGLYVGCGNGRNFIPLLKTGLNLRGIDISQTGIEQLIERYPAAEGTVWSGDFSQIHSARVFDYLIAIQVFQHGSEQEVRHYFQTAHDVLEPVGKLFLRVNSVSTQINHSHKIVEQRQHGGFTVQYEEGPKAGTLIHFYSKEELDNIADSFGFDIIQPIEEAVEPRHEHADGHWAQWESIWQKKK